MSWSGKKFSEVVASKNASGSGSVSHKVYIHLIFENGPLLKLRTISKNLPRIPGPAQRTTTQLNISYKYLHTNKEAMPLFNLFIIVSE